MPKLLNRSRLVILLVLLQLVVLAVMAGKREYIRAFGQEVFLRTAPIDPRDPFRGDFVRLSYPFSTLSTQQIRPGVDMKTLPKGQPVFALLTPAARGLYAFDTLTTTPPTDGTFIRGRVEYDWRSPRGGNLNVRYGIEQLFVQQGEGRAIEKRRGIRGGLQVPMEVRVALGSDGTAVVKDFRWSPLGIQVELLRFNRRARANNNAETAVDGPIQPLSPRLRLTLQNVSEQTLTLADPAGPCSLTLVSANLGIETYPQADTTCAAPNLQPDAQTQIQLAPQEDIALELELGERRWHVLEADEPVEIGALKQPAMFRLIYHSPAPGQSDSTYWVGDLPSQAFNAFGRID